MALLEAFLDRERSGFERDKGLHDKARALSVAYTTSASALEPGPPIAPDAAASLAYLAYFGPRAIAAVAHALAFASVPAHCVDVGAGSGASALVLALFGARKLTLIDTSAASLLLAKRLLSFASGRLPSGVEVRTIVGEASKTVDAHAALVLSAFMFGESEGEPSDALAALGKNAPQAKTMIIVDAGDRPRARRLQTARDALVSSAGLHPLAARGLVVRAPCPHIEPCPALVRERDWCHARVDKDLPPKLARFARAVGRDDERMSASFLVLDDRPPDDTGIVVIGDVLKEKGRARLPVCGPGGLRFLQAEKRDRRAYDALRNVARGQRLSMAAAATARNGTGHVSDEAQLA